MNITAPAQRHDSLTLRLSVIISRLPTGDALSMGRCWTRLVYLNVRIAGMCVHVCCVWISSVAGCFN